MAWANEYTFTHGALLINTVSAFRCFRRREIHENAADQYLRGYHDGL